MFSSLFMKLGVPGKGLLTSDGYEAERGVCRVGLLGRLPSLVLVSTTEGAEILRAAMFKRRGKRWTKRVTWVDEGQCGPEFQPDG